MSIPSKRTVQVLQVRMRVSSFESTAPMTAASCLGRDLAIFSTRSRHSNRDLLDRVVAVAQPVPLGTLGLMRTGQIGRRARMVRSPIARPASSAPATASCSDCVRLPARFLPVAAVDAHVDARNQRRAGPCDAADGQFTRVHRRLRRWLGDQGADPLHRDRLAEDSTVALPFVSCLSPW